MATRDSLKDGIDAGEAEVVRARLSFEQGLREASRAGTRAARRVVTPALVGAGIVGGALLLLALARLARRPSDGALIRVVIETPRSPKRVLPALGGVMVRWLLERQLRGGGPLGALLGAVEGSGRRYRRGGRAMETVRDEGHYES